MYGDRPFDPGAAGLSLQQLRAQPFVRPTVVFLGQDIQIGQGTVIADFVVVYDHVRIGRNCYIGPFSVLGGLSFAWDGAFPHLTPKVHHAGLEIGDGVSIGAHCVIDRGVDRNTYIGHHAKIDAQVRIAHDTVVGAESVIVGQSGLAGEVTIGKRSWLGGQSGIAAKVTLGDGCAVGAQSGVTKSWKAGSRLFGNPARPAWEAFRRLLPPRRRRTRWWAFWKKEG